MTRSARLLVAAALLVGCVLSGAPSANAQLIGLSDEIILISKGRTKKTQGRQQSNLGAAPSAAENPFAHLPGGRGQGLTRHANPAQSTVSFRSGGGSVLSSLSAPGPQIVRSAAPLGAANPQLKTEELPPLYGPLELPVGDVEGPADGLTLNAAIDRLVRFNADLRAKGYEIPQARADVITAGLRGNPFYFLSASSFPYAPYSPNRPGSNGYSASVVQPVDVNHKRSARTAAAMASLNVLEAQYKDAVRLAIDELYNAFLDVVVARETIRYAKTSLAGARRLLETSETQLQAGAITNPYFLSISIQHDAAEIGLERAKAQALQARQTLAAMLALPPDAAARLEVRGALRDAWPPPPPRAELVQTALAVRPDVTAFRLGIARAQADLKVNKKEVFEDIFVIYSPYQIQNNHPVGGQNATSYSFGLLGTIPLYNRNQGDIRRAQYNIVQARVAWEAIQRQVVAEVERADVEYHATRRSVERLEQSILPASEEMRRGVMELREKGEKSQIDVFEAQRQHNELVRQYRDTVIAHRRAMLRLNTAVGQRVLP
jgi:outer membrane protein, heavy metal efflux system